ncbi:MAG TPA: hypothetical protein DCF82_23180 [Marinobacter hydrocarbonoclasticus]|uniref:XRE family transcriptional regulator n=1 Tax=Marinobacter nauticus TaxID=2743 RepID=A0A3B8WQC5_MARNT|nr:hypothetical protein [Marinobacter nauticus]
MNKSLYDQLKAYLLSAKGDWQTIARDCDVDSSWPYKVMSGRIKDPGVLRTERILKYARSKGWKPAKSVSGQQDKEAA